MLSRYSTVFLITPCGKQHAYDSYKSTGIDAASAPYNQHMYIECNTLSPLLAEFLNNISAVASDRLEQYAAIN